MAQNDINTAEKLLKSGQIEKAREVFLQFDGVPVAIEYLGDIASFNKNWDAAIEYYETLVDLDPVGLPSRVPP